MNDKYISLLEYDSDELSSMQPYVPKGFFYNILSAHIHDEFSSLSIASRFRSFLSFLASA